MLDILNHKCLLLLGLILQQAFIAEALLAYFGPASVHKFWEVRNLAVMTGDFPLKFLSCACYGVESQSGAQAREKTRFARTNELKDLHNACLRSKEQFGHDLVRKFKTWAMFLNLGEFSKQKMRVNLLFASLITRFFHPIVMLLKLMSE